jgi:hypothetical protein
MIGVCVTLGRSENYVQYLVSKYGKGDTIWKTYPADWIVMLEDLYVLPTPTVVASAFS